MHFHPDAAPKFVQLQCAGAAWDPKVPVMAAGAPGQFALALDDETAAATLVERLPGGELEIEFEHGRV